VQPSEQNCLTFVPYFATEALARARRCEEFRGCQQYEEAVLLPNALLAPNTQELRPSVHHSVDFFCVESGVGNCINAGNSRDEERPAGAMLEGVETCCSEQPSYIPQGS
jgi:hypothetical protein